MRHGQLSAELRAEGNPRDSAYEENRGQEHSSCPMTGLTSESYYHLFGRNDNRQCHQSVSEDRLNAIGKKMVGTNDPDNGQAGKWIPAGYTYLGQFLVHDLTRSNLTGREVGGRTIPSENLRTPGLDLDSLYGQGPEVDSHLYQRPQPNIGGRYLFRLGKTIIPESSTDEGFQTSNHDLPRIETGCRGISGDEGHCIDPVVADTRNDDHLLLSQLTSLFLLIHNRVAKSIKKTEKSNHECFNLAHEFMVKSYRKIVVQDYISRLLHPSIREEFFKESSSIFDFAGCPNGLPLEFVFGVGRIGHAMVRSSYRVNRFEAGSRGKLDRILDFSSLAPDSNLPVPADWVVDWSNFFETSDAEPQRARRISPFWARPMISFRNSLMNHSLAFRDLSRSSEHQVRSGQECALALRDLLKTKLKLKIPILSIEDLTPKQTAPPISELLYINPLVEEIKSTKHFQQNTPLLYYLIQESIIHGNHGQILGPLGSYILAATIGQTLYRSKPWGYLDEGQALAHSKISRGVCTMPDLIAILNMGHDEVLARHSETI